MPKPSPIELDFSRKYDFEHSQQYLHKHQDGLARRLSHWRDVQVARRALQMADKPNLVLDLPCGAGRFWPMLCEQPNRVIFAADNSADMIATARAAQTPEVVARINSFRTSAFDIDLGANAVDCVFCIRLLHHIEFGRTPPGHPSRVSSRQPRYGDRLAMGRRQLQSLETPPSGGP